MLTFYKPLSALRPKRSFRLETERFMLAYIIKLSDNYVKTGLAKSNLQKIVKNLNVGTLSLNFSKLYFSF